MSETSDTTESTDTEDEGSKKRVSRPTLAQVRTVIAFMGKHPDLAHRRLRVGMGHAMFKNLWTELSNTLNSMGGAVKSTQGWIKFWSDKRRSILIKYKEIEKSGTAVKKRKKKNGKSKVCEKLTPLEIQILDLCHEPKSDDNDQPRGDGLLVAAFSKKGERPVDCTRVYPTEAEDSQLDIMENMLQLLNQQSVALTHMARASLFNSKSLERIAEATNIQGQVINRMARSCEAIGASVQDVKNAIIGIDYTMKRCYPPSTTEVRQITNIFS